RALFPALYNNTIPRSVSTAGGPASTSHESKYPGRGERTLNGRPLSSSTGDHDTRSSELAISTSGTLKYIQYFPFTFVATHRSPTNRHRIAPDFVSMRESMGSAGPCFSHATRSRDVATASRGTSRFHWVYVST